LCCSAPKCAHQRRADISLLATGSGAKLPVGSASWHCRAGVCDYIF
jgi:hypothetical protein